MNATYASLIIANKASGLLCKTCGIIVGTKGNGKPRNCHVCTDLNTSERAANELLAADAESRAVILAGRTCPICQKVLRTTVGRDQHIRMVHGGTS
jgi:hypothetical protein